jgi:hypothetical protein
LTTPEADPQKTATPAEPLAKQPGPELDPKTPVDAAPSAESEPWTGVEADEAPPPPLTLSEATRPIATARAVAPGERELVYVPLAVNIGDGFKFGCGFFLAMVLAVLVGFVVLAALFVLTTLAGLNLPLTR